MLFIIHDTAVLLRFTLASSPERLQRITLSAAKPSALDAFTLPLHLARIVQFSKRHETDFLLCQALFPLLGQ